MALHRPKSAGVSSAGRGDSSHRSRDELELPIRSIDELKRMTRELRRDIVKMIGQAGSGHPGGSLSAVEIVTALFFHEMRHRPSDPAWPDRDRFILSKGHAAPVLYAALAEAGYFPKSWLENLRRIDGPLQGHPDRLSTPGVEVSTGSLGQGLSVGVGMALAARLDSRDYRVYVLVGCGEANEGQIWEASMAAAHYRLDNLVGILDFNGMQIDGLNRDVMDIEPVVDKWRSFGWHVIDLDGHSIEELLDAFAVARDVSGRPTMIVARTIKGKGVSFMENVVDFHGKAPTLTQMEQALLELSE